MESYSGNLPERVWCHCETLDWEHRRSLADVQVADAIIIPDSMDASQVPVPDPDVSAEARWHSASLHTVWAACDGHHAAWAQRRRRHIRASYDQVLAEHPLSPAEPRDQRDGPKFVCDKFCVNCKVRRCGCKGGACKRLCNNCFSFHVLTEEDLFLGKIDASEVEVKSLIARKSRLFAEKFDCMLDCLLRARNSRRLAARLTVGTRVSKRRRMSLRRKGCYDYKGAHRGKLCTATISAAGRAALEAFQDHYEDFLTAQRENGAAADLKDRTAWQGQYEAFLASEQRRAGKYDSTKPPHH